MHVDDQICLNDIPAYLKRNALLLSHLVSNKNVPILISEM